MTKKTKPLFRGAFCLFVVQQRRIEPRFVMGQNADDLDKFIFQFVAGADDVDHAVFFQIFGALKTVRKFFREWSVQ